jgi:hypothetical protein
MGEPAQAGQRATPQDRYPAARLPEPDGSGRLAGGQPDEVLLLVEREDHDLDEKKTRETVSCLICLLLLSEIQERTKRTF